MYRRTIQSRLIRSLRCWRSLVLLCLLTALSAPALAGDGAGPSVQDVEEAGERFNRGRDAFQEDDFAAAAEHFEKADSLAPNPKVLLLAIRSRAEAGHEGRAATLSALAKRLYPDDSAFDEVEDLLATARQTHGRLRLRCVEACRVLVGQRLVHGPPQKKRTIFLTEGEYRIRVEWDGSQSDAQTFEASPASSAKLRFKKSAPDVDEPAASDEPDWGESEEAEESWHADETVSAPEDGSDALSESDGLSSAWFWTGASVTIVLVGVSSWSAIDTLNNPGADVVKRDCAPNDKQCPAYVRGVENQSRTNLLWGVTAGATVVSAVLAGLTDWGGSGAGSSGVDAGAAPAQQVAGDVQWAPWVNLGQAVGLSATGTF